MDRGEWYEDPLSETLEKKQMGKVTGGGSALGDDFKVVHADLEIALANLDSAFQLARDCLEKIGVPAGSELIYEVDGEVKSIPFGNRETISIYLDGVGLPDEVYENADFDQIVNEISETVNSRGAGEYRGFSQGETETALYVFAPSADSTYEALQGVIAKHPLFQNARVVLKYMAPEKPEKEFRITGPGV
ncbi:MAG: hypothetical protein ABL962_15415 [Fimbriimonadaceae bacterium]